ncbi:hypothetical protein [Roseomonas sp. 18066]|uniref:hypothetical protein n=1 Tax=Roseomonas sp. 18066 TaxID=2681412 RepID=UPI00135A0F6B|nr:hypothetical protein [Roseomonas sp. 18066]
MRGSPATLLLSCLMLGGCGTGLFTERGANPVLLDRFGEHQGRPDYGVIATGAEKRLVLIRYDKDDGKIPEVVCTEPPPDALSAVASAFGAAARAAAEAPAAGQGAASVAAEFNRSFSSSSSAMLYRSQGLQLIRDLQFTLCVSRMNALEQGDGITARSYEARLDRVIELGVSLIRAEMPAIQEAAGRPLPAAAAPTLNFPNVRTVESVVTPNATKP